MKVLQRNLRSRTGQSAVLIVFLLAILCALSLIAHQPGVDALDLRTTRYVQSFRSPAVDVVAKTFTFLGGPTVLSVLTVIVAGALWFYGRRLAAAATVVTLIGLPIDVGLKDWVGRPRPNGSMVSVLGPTFGLSFPSGHAMASTMFYGFMAYLVWILGKDYKGRKYIAGCLALFPFFISWSRIYLGAHWLSDVLGGWTSALILLLIMTTVYRRRASREQAVVAPQEVPAQELKAQT